MTTRYEVAPAKDQAEAEASLIAFKAELFALAAKHGVVALFTTAGVPFPQPGATCGCAVASYAWGDPRFIELASKDALACIPRQVAAVAQEGAD